MIVVACLLVRLLTLRPGPLTPVELCHLHWVRWCRARGYPWYREDRERPRYQRPDQPNGAREYASLTTGQVQALHLLRRALDAGLVHEGTAELEGWEPPPLT